MVFHSCSTCFQPRLEHMCSKHLKGNTVGKLSLQTTASLQKHSSLPATTPSTQCRQQMESATPRPHGACDADKELSTKRAVYSKSDTLLQCILSVAAGDSMNVSLSISLAACNSESALAHLYLFCLSLKPVAQILRNLCSNFATVGYMKFTIACCKKTTRA